MCRWRRIHRKISHDTNPNVQHLDGTNKLRGLILILYFQPLERFYLIEKKYLSYSFFGYDPRLFGRAEILVIFGLHFGRNMTS